MPAPIVPLGEKKVGAMTYVTQGPGALDYFPYRYDASRLLFRGPRRDLEAPYVAFIGGTQTFGKFIEQPYPMKVEHLTGVTSANLGQQNAGLDVFANEPTVHGIAQNARVTVLEVLGAANQSNRFYAVHPRRNDRFLRAPGPLRKLYPDVDFTQFNFTQHMLNHLLETDPERFGQIKRSLQRAWVRRMERLMEALGDVVVLIDLSTKDECIDGQEQALSAPTFITNEMLHRLKQLSDGYVRMPPSTALNKEGTKGMVYSSFQVDAARALHGPDFHTQVAKALLPVLDRLM